MTLVKWRPVNSLDAFSNFDSMLDSFFSSPPAYRNRRNADIMPRVNVSENDKEYQFRVEIPGIDKKDVELSFKEDVLTIKGERVKEKNEEKECSHCNEITYGKFERSFRLANPVIDSKITAAYKNGILDIVVPKEKVEEPVAQKILIK
ncbi:MAG: Hsp20/alpha crystallin family protein [bacterium]|nr:Hsp20/alpha crystallin family protein [bacterium]